MGCKACSSVNQQRFSGELAIAFPGIQRTNLPPAYICQNTLVCLDCGYTELVVPASELEELRKGMNRYRPVQLVTEYSRLL